tara:strand:+ start:71063 stop:71338 length:276 start_codon:yes stop_codon:yes gene_type:complete
MGLAVHYRQKMQLYVDRRTAQQAQQMPREFIIVDERSHQVPLSFATVGNRHGLNRCLRLNSTAHQPPVESSHPVTRSSGAFGKDDQTIALL